MPKRLCVYLTDERLAKLGGCPTKRILEMIDLLPAVAPKPGRDIKGRLLPGFSAGPGAAPRIEVVDVPAAEEVGP